MGHNPADYAGVDRMIWASFLVIFVCFLWSWLVLPIIMPEDTKRTHPLSFFFGTSCLKYYRGPKDPQMTEDSFPDSGGSAEHNIEDMGKKVEAIWWPTHKTRLWTCLLKHLWKWWAFALVMFGIQRVMQFVAGTELYNYVIKFQLEDDVHFGIVAIKLMFLGFIVSVGQGAIENWCRLVLAVKGTDPVYCGLALCVVQKLHRLSLAGMQRTHSAEAQQVARESFDVAVSCWHTPLKTAPMDLGLGLYSLYCLYDLIGASCIVLCTLAIALLYYAGQVCDGRKFVHESKLYEAHMIRGRILNQVLDNFRELKLYNWTDRVARPLAEVRTTVKRSSLMSSLWGSLSGVITSQIDGVMMCSACFAIVFLKGQRLDFGRAMMARVYMGTIMGNFMGLMACRWSWYDMVGRSARIEYFLRLPERSFENVTTGKTKLVGASFGWPKPPTQEAPRTEESNSAVPDAGDSAAKGPDETHSVILRDIDFEPQDGELVLICGSRGSGKSTLLQAILGEIDCVKGQVHCPDDAVAYQPQLPYLIEGTIRDNVLFGIPEEEADDDIIKLSLNSAQLAQDISDPRNTLHAEKENTNVGRRGSHLSGGQRARTALARTVYAVKTGAKMALLDDPVASVDNEVVQGCWEEAIVKAMSGVTRIVVVNSQLLERLAHTADRLLVVSEGRIVYCGSPAKAMEDPAILNEALGGSYRLAESGMERQKSYIWLEVGVKAVEAFAAYFGNPAPGLPFTEDHLNVLKHNNPEETFENLCTQKFIKEGVPSDVEPVVAQPEKKDETKEEADDTADPALDLADFLRENERLMSFISAPPRKAQALKDGEAEAAEADGKADGAEDSGPPIQLSASEWEKLRQQLVSVERKYKPVVTGGRPRLTTMQTVFSFIWKMRGLTLVSMFGGIVLSFKDAIIMGITQHWANRDSNSTTSNSDFLTMIMLAFFVFAVAGVVNGFVDGFGVLNLTQSLMKDIDQTLARLSMPYFWHLGQKAEPQLRKAINTPLEILTMIAKLPIMIVECLLLVFMTAFYAPMLWCLLPIAAIGFYRMSFLSDWRNLQVWPIREQLQSQAWTKVVEQWDILFSMRALKRQYAFQRKTYKGIMVISFSNYMVFQMQILMGFVQHTIGAVFTAVAMLIMIRMRQSGMSATSTFGFWSLAQQFNGKIEAISQMAMPFKDVKKQFDLMQDFLCTDAVENDEGNVPEPEWPGEGRLEFEGITFRYGPYMQPAVRNLNLSVRPAEKLGIIGKTGSGKSTLVTMLLRLGPLKGVPPQSGGRLLLDGVDIWTLNLSELRKRISVVPQEPTVFYMNLKDNIGEEFTDAEVLTALTLCGLDARELTSLEEGQPLTEALSRGLHEGMSTGTQQLLMAARALVRRPKVLILDECTASLDRESADRLLEVVMTNTKDSTVLSIAHRLRFVAKMDRILVLSMGDKIDCAPPAQLLEQPDSYYAKNLRLENLQDGIREDAS